MNTIKEYALSSFRKGCHDYRMYMKWNEFVEKAFNVTSKVEFFEDILSNYPKMGPLDMI